jgi:hypothetical protein
MAYLLKYADGSAQVLNGRVAITRQDNDLTKPDTVQASFSTTIALPSDVATHARLGHPHLGTSLSTAPYQGQACALEASGVEVLPGAQLRLDDYTARAGYTGKLLAGNKSFYDLLGDKTLRELDLSAFDHDWSLAAVVAGASHTSYKQGYVYDLYDRGLGAPPQYPLTSPLYQAGYWPTTYARAVWEAIFLGAGVKWSGDLPAVFDSALLPATQPYGHSDTTRAAHELVAGYPPMAQRLRFTEEQNAVLPVGRTLPTKQDASLHQGAAVQYDSVAFTRTITLTGFYDLKAEQEVHLYANPLPIFGTVSATLQLFLNGKPVGTDDSLRGKGNLDTTLTALAERHLLQPGDVVTARYKFDKWKDGGLFNNTGPVDASWDLMPTGRLTVQLLADFPPRGRVRLADWLPDMSQKDYIKAFIQTYGLTQTTDPYTGAVTFRRTAGVLDTPGQDWTERRDGSQPAKRSWKLGDFAQRNWFRWKEDESNTGYQRAVFEQTHVGQFWNDETAKKAAQAFAAGSLDVGVTDTGLAATKDVLSLPFAASLGGVEGLLLIPYWKPKAGTDYAADLVIIQDAVNDGTYSPEEAAAARVKALADDYETQTPEPRLCYQLVSTRQVVLEDDLGKKQEVSMRLSYFVNAGQEEDFDFTRSLLPRYYPHLAAALARPLVLRPYVRLSAAELVAFDQLQRVWLQEEQAWFFVNKVDSWEEDQASTAVELIRL